MIVQGNTWIVVLAGGNGRRLEALTLDGTGQAVPKQFYRFRDNKTLLQWTLERAGRLAPPARIVAVVRDIHRHWWEPDLAGLPPENVLSQPEDRGTAAAVLHALIQIVNRDPSAIIVVMPSDHEVEDEDVLRRATLAAVHSARIQRDRLFLLGIQPEGADPEYGWILPGPDGRREPDDGQTVVTFVEKPSPSGAECLMRWGALWNSFIFAVAGTALFDMFERATPVMVRAYLQNLPERPDEPGLAACFRGLPARDFGRDLLQREVERLRLLTVPPCGWTDLGTPARLDSWRRRRSEAQTHASRASDWRPAARVAEAQPA